MASSAFTGSPTTAVVPSATSPTASATSTGSGSGGDQDGGGPRTLLFFVALGFGVVFTNLWIIVGVKYCFRYNRRNRALQNEENPEPIDLANINRPRRRREKKLMSMEDVNSRFPLTKYKIWCATREQEGLPAAGGVTAPPSRAPSIKESVRESIGLAPRTDVPVIEDSAPTTQATDFAGSSVLRSTDATREAAPRASLDTKKPGVPLTNVASIDSVADEKATSAPQQRPEQDDDDDEEDPIQHAAPTELMAQPGDACAICIDNLEDDDEVRGLTCGHAFHAGCIDPWLTGRRACCPLCKADYFVPKPRPGQTEATAGNDAAPATALQESRERENATSTETTRSGLSAWMRLPQLSRHGRSLSNPSPPRSHPDSRGTRAVNWLRTIPENLPSVRRPAAARVASGRNEQATTTAPVDLEAGRQTV